MYVIIEDDKRKRTLLFKFYIVRFENNVRFLKTVQYQLKHYKYRDWWFLKEVYEKIKLRGGSLYISYKEMEINMRLDKYLKVSRLIKRRTVANEACDASRVMINDKPAKASTQVKVGDIITIAFGNKEVKVEVLDVQETVKKDEAKELFRYI